jgi:hypothetical protein
MLTYIPFCFFLAIFQIEFHAFSQASLDNNPPTYASNSSWDDKCVPPHTALLIEMGVFLFAQADLKP